MGPGLVRPGPGQARAWSGPGLDCPGQSHGGPWGPMGPMGAYGGPWQPRAPSGAPEGCPWAVQPQGQTAKSGSRRHQIGAEWGRHAFPWADTLRIHCHGLWHASGGLRGALNGDKSIKNVDFHVFWVPGGGNPLLLGMPIVPLWDARCYCHPIVPFAGCRYVALLPSERTLQLVLQDVSGAKSQKAVATKGEHGSYSNVLDPKRGTWVTCECVCVCVL